MKRSRILIFFIVLFCCVGCNNNGADSKLSKQNGFWKDGNKISVEITYLPETAEEFVETEGVAVFKKLPVEGDGEIYSIVVDSNDGSITNKRLDYFYVQDEKIYTLENYNELSKVIDEESKQIVYQEKGLSEEDKNGNHYIIENKSDKVIFSLSTDNVETGFYKIMEWDKDKKLKVFKSGYGAERDLFKVKFK